MFRYAINILCLACCLSLSCRKQSHDDHKAMDKRYHSALVAFQALQFLESCNAPLAAVRHLERHNADNSYLSTITEMTTESLIKGKKGEAIENLNLYIDMWMVDRAVIMRRAEFPDYVDGTNVIDLVSNIARYRKKYVRHYDDILVSESMNNILERSLMLIAETESQQKAETINISSNNRITSQGIQPGARDDPKTPIKIGEESE